MIGLIVYLVLCAVVWYFATGYWLHEMKSDYRDLDGEILLLGIVMGLVCALVSFLVIPCGIIYYSWQRWGNAEAIASIFPNPRIESKAERIKRQQDEITANRRAINMKEKELGLEPTKW